MKIVKCPNCGGVLRIRTSKTESIGVYRFTAYCAGGCLARSDWTISLDKLQTPEFTERPEIFACNNHPNLHKQNDDQLEIKL